MFITVRGHQCVTYSRRVGTRTGLYTDGIYHGATAPRSATYFDWSAVEVLKGPQGLLFDATLRPERSTYHGEAGTGMHGGFRRVWAPGAGRQTSRRW